MDQSGGQYAFEVSGPTLASTNVGAKEVKSGKMYMVTVGAHFRFPIHPEPNADHKIAKLVRQYEVIVATEETEGLYIKTVLPVSGWIRKSCIDDGTLVPVTKDTFSQLIDESKIEKPSKCEQCIRNSGCLSGISTSVRKHPVYVMAGYLLLQFLAEVVIFVDLVTDVLVAITLSYAGENWLFMLTCVFMLAPYYIAWAAAFGYLQKLAMESTASKENEEGRATSHATDASDMADVKIKDDNGNVEETEEDQDTQKLKGSSPDKKIQIGVILFAIAPIGVCFLLCMDVYLLLEDFIIKPVYLCCTKTILREESHAEKGYKKLRRVSEVVAETICQTVLQIWIIASYHKGSINEGVRMEYVRLSLITSIVVLILWTVVLSIEAKGFGLHFYEYVTVVLQGSFNFVPYLPAIERGKRASVNWTDFGFDSHSVGLVSKALISPECNLKSIKLSAHSLRKLTRHECKFLGQMLADSPKDSVNVVFSRSRKEIEGLFNKFDTDNSRSFDFVEFLELCTALRQNDDGVVSAADVSEIFLMLADNVTHEVYLTDLLWKINKSTARLPVVDYDSPVMYALKAHDAKLLTFMIAAKVCDDVTWEYYTTTLVTSNRHEDALMMAEEKGIPLVVELISGHALPAHDFDENNPDAPGTSDPYCSVSVADKVKRTETIHKNLNPQWRQPLLFILPVEDIPTTVSATGADNIGALQPIQRNISDNYTNASSGQIRKRGTGSYAAGAHPHKRTRAHHHNNKDQQQKGIVGSTSSRLEINFKIYDYDETDDDFFMGSYKHKIQWNIKDLMSHQNGANKPRTIESQLTNREMQGSFKFRIYTGTLQYYIKWGKNKQNKNDAQ